MGWVAALALLCAIGAALWVSREDLGHQLSQGTERARLLEDAGRALASGQLSRPDGLGAAELYGAVLAQDPDHHAAREGMLATGRAAVEQAHAALAQGRPGDVPALVDLARRLSVPESELEPVLVAHRRTTNDEQTLGDLLREADRRRRGATPDEALDGVLPLYEQALSIAPGNVLAASGRTRLLDEVLRAVQADLDDGEFDRAHERVQRVAAADPGHIGLPPVRARLSEARSARPTRAPPTPDAAAPGPETVSGYESTLLAESEIDDLFQGFQQAIADEQFLEPPGASAWDRLRRLHAGAPDDARTGRADATFREAAHACFERHLPTPRLSAAEACLDALEAFDPRAAGGSERSRRLASRWIGLAEERLGSSERAAARRAYESARAIDPSHPGLAALAARLEQAGGG